MAVHNLEGAAVKRREQDEVIRRAKRTQDALSEVVRRLPHLLARDTETAGRDGYSPGGGGPGRTSDPRPTEAVAVARVEHGEMPDPFHEGLAAVLTHLAVASAAAASMTLELAKLDRMGTTRQSGAIVCVNPHCATVITGVGNDRPRRGRCRRCWAYLNEHDRDWTPRVDRQGAA